MGGADPTAGSERGCTVRAPGGDVVVRRDRAGVAWRGAGPRGQAAGALRDVLAACAAAAEPEWLDVAARTLEDEHRAGVGRAGLIVRRGGDEAWFHVTRAGNRGSIREHGLDAHRMAHLPGIAGNTTPEAPGAFLCDAETVTFFRGMTTDPTDVWAVRATGLWLASAAAASGGFDDGWVVTAAPVPPGRLRRATDDAAFA